MQIACISKNRAIGDPYRKNITMKYKPFFFEIAGLQKHPIYRDS
jgi:hypothetical protein